MSNINESSREQERLAQIAFWLCVASGPAVLGVPIIGLIGGWPLVGLLLDILGLSAATLSVLLSAIVLVAAVWRSRRLLIPLLFTLCGASLLAMLSLYFGALMLIQTPAGERFH